MFSYMKLKQTTLRDLSTGFMDISKNDTSTWLFFCNSSFQEGRVKVALLVLVIPLGMTRFEVYFPTD